MVEHFSDHPDVKDILRTMLMGSATQASRIANVAAKVLSTEELVPRLLNMLRDLQAIPTREVYLTCHIRTRGTVICWEAGSIPSRWA